MLGESEAVQLFVERTVAVQPHFALTARNARTVAEICTQLDGIPLALELAAARVRGLALEHLAARLDQRFRLLTAGSRTALPRQQTLHATVDWSYGLLRVREQQLFNRLAVFAGGFTLEAAEVVCAGEELAADEVLDVLLRLVDKSLVVAEERAGDVERYRLLETLRQYGRERLVASGEAAALHRQHAQYYLALAEQAEPGLRGPVQVAWLDRLELEHANLGTALAWSLDDDESQTCTAGETRANLGLRLAGALLWFWVLRGHRLEGRRWLGHALARSHELPQPARAKALVAAGVLAVVTGDRLEVVLALLAEGVALYRAVGEKRGLAYALAWLGFCTRGQEHFPETGNRENYERGTVLVTESLTLAREVADPWYLASSLLLLALSADVHQEEQWARGRAAAEESLTLMHEVGDTFGLQLVHRSLGWLALYEGDYPRAAEAFAAELAAARMIGARSSIAFVLFGLGDVACGQGALGEARELYEQSLALYRELDVDRQWLARVLRRLGEVALEQGDWSLAQARVGESLVIARIQEVSGEPQLAPALEVLGGLAAALGRAERALLLAGAAAAQRERTSQPPWPQEERALARWLAPARRAVSEAAQRAAWAEGLALPIEAAVALALEGCADGG
jgi:tetratricopeptide (TPR) repeat protein